MMYIMVDVEADGPIPGRYSMIELGAVAVEPGLNRVFHAKLRPISDEYMPEALAITGYTREQTLHFDEPARVMSDFEKWVISVDPKRPIFISDNNGFDWMFVCWYFHMFLGRNPFGHSSQNLNSLYKGLTRDLFGSFKHLRNTPHDHNPVNDARGNAEALLALIEKYRLKY
ncbi:MAG: exonuclease [Candidatus Bathyarchaeia archaeon]